MASFTTLDFFPFLSTVLVFLSLTIVSVVVINALSFSSKSPLFFLTLLLGLAGSLIGCCLGLVTRIIRFLWKWVTDILRHDFSA